jgi:thioredoxin 2
MSNESIILRCRSCRTLNRVPLDKLSAHPVCSKCKTPLDYPHAPINVTTASYDQQVNDWPEFLLVEFWARWCGYCRKIEPFVNELASKRAARLKVIKLDVDAESAVARRFTVKATPTFILYHNGRQLARMDGAPQNDSDLENWLNQLIRQHSP